MSLNSETVSSNGDISFSFELFPPKTEKSDKLFWEAVDSFLRFDPTFISLTCGAGGTVQDLDTERVVKLQKRANIPAAAHLTCVGKTKEDVDALAQRYWDEGIKHIVALRGDVEGLSTGYVPDPKGYAYAADLVAGLKKVAPFDISVAGYPEKHPEASSLAQDIEYLKQKVDAGADRILTQFFFDHSCFLRYRDAVAAAGINIPVIPGILPIMNFKRVKSFAKKCGASIPTILDDIFNDAGEDAAAQQMVSAYVAMQQCQSLYREGIKDFHFFTLNSGVMTNMLCILLRKFQFKDFFDMTGAEYKHYLSQK